MQLLVAPLIVSVALLHIGHAWATTYYKCIDGKGAVTMQQTPCAGTAAQKERKAWTNATSGTTPSDESSPYIRQWKAIEAERKREVDAAEAQAAAEGRARAESQRKSDLQRCLSARARADLVNDIRSQQASAALQKRDFNRMSTDERRAFIDTYRPTNIDCTRFMN